MDSQRHELLRHINECSDSFTSSSVQTSSLNLAEKLVISPHISISNRHRHSTRVHCDFRYFH